MGISFAEIVAWYWATGSWTPGVNGGLVTSLLDDIVKLDMDRFRRLPMTRGTIPPVLVLRPTP